MSKAWKCDICGTLYESDKDGCTNFVRLGRVNSNDYYGGVDEGGSFHICPSCNLAVKKVLDDLRKESNRNKTMERALYVMTKGEVKDGN